MNRLKVNMFGDFSIYEGEKHISCKENRSRKVWSLIAYLIYNRERVISPKELIDVIWSEEDKDINYNGALKTLLYRARAELDNLNDGFGKRCILFNGEGYSWNNEISVFVDCEDFESVAVNIETRSLDDIIRVMKYFQRDFLDCISTEFWVMPIATYFRNLFIDSLRTIVPSLIEKFFYDEALEFCQVAVNVEPYNEEVYQLYMKVCISCGMLKKAAGIYQRLSEKLISELGVIASEETRSLYHEAIKTNNLNPITVDTLREQLRESSDKPGALVCEYDFFKVLYYSMARSIMRTGFAVHIALISVVTKNEEIPPQKLDKLMMYVEGVICRSLRRGDSVARCSISQYVIMLPRADYENSCMVCERIVKLYNKKNIHNNATLSYSVCPIEPDDKENFQWIREPLDN